MFQVCLFASFAQVIIWIITTVCLVNQRGCHQSEAFEGDFFCFAKIGFAQLAARLAIDIPVPAMAFALAPHGERSQRVSEGKRGILFLGQPAIPLLRANHDGRELTRCAIRHV